MGSCRNDRFAVRIIPADAVARQEDTGQFIAEEDETLWNADVHPGVGAIVRSRPEHLVRLSDVRGAGLVRNYMTSRIRNCSDVLQIFIIQTAVRLHFARVRMRLVDLIS